MAIDTRARRESAFIDPAGMLHPDGSIAVSDRLTLVGQYAGIAAAEAAADTLILTTRAGSVNTATRTGYAAASGRAGLTRGGGRG